MTSSTIRFRDVSANFCFRQRRQRIVAVISLVGYGFDLTFRLHSFPDFFLVAGSPPSRRCPPPPVARSQESSPYPPPLHRSPSPPLPLRFQGPPRARPCRPDAYGRPSSA